MRNIFKKRKPNSKAQAPQNLSPAARKKWMAFSKINLGNYNLLDGGISEYMLIEPKSFFDASESKSLDIK